MNHYQYNSINVAYQAAYLAHVTNPLQRPTIFGRPPHTAWPPGLVRPKRCCKWGSSIYSLLLATDSLRLVRGFSEVMGIHGKIECRAASRGIRSVSKTVNRRASVLNKDRLLRGVCLRNSHPGAKRTYSAHAVTLKEARIT